jgi:hypothetical protein
MPHEAPSLEGWSVWCKECKTYRPLTACKSVDPDDGTVYFEYICNECGHDVIVLHRTDPGPGGFYDELGNPKNRPHLVMPTTWDKDPAYFQNPLTGFGFRNHNLDPSKPRAWLRHAESLYDAPLTLKYTGLDPKATYRVKAVYNNERPTSTIAGREARAAVTKTRRLRSDIMDRRVGAHFGSVKLRDRRRAPEISLSCTPGMLHSG